LRRVSGALAGLPGPSVCGLDRVALLYYCTNTGGIIMYYGVGGIIVIVLLVLFLAGRL
jgi:hypothetical protein